MAPGAASSRRASRSGLPFLPDAGLQNALATSRGLEAELSDDDLDVKDDGRVCPEMPLPEIRKGDIVTPLVRAAGLICIPDLSREDAAGTQLVRTDLAVGSSNSECKATVLP